MGDRTRISVFVDRRYIAYRPPYHVEVKSGIVIGCDAGGANCVRFEDGPHGHVGCCSGALMTAACEALNEAAIAPMMVSSVTLTEEPEHG